MCEDASRLKTDYVIVGCCYCWMLLLLAAVIVGCCYWLLLLVVVVGCRCYTSNKESTNNSNQPTKIQQPTVKPTVEQPTLKTTT